MVCKHTSGLVNKSQSAKSIWSFGKDNPFNSNEFDIDADEEFIQFNTTGTIV